MNPGALNAGGTSLFGGPINDDAFSGLRVTVGGWLDSSGTIGLEGSAFILPTQSRTFRAASDPNGNPVLALRYLDVPPANPLGTEDAFQASIPGMFAGGLAVRTFTRLWGAEANAVVALDASDPRFQGIIGFRYLDLTDSLDLAWSSQALNDAMVSFLGNMFPAPSTVTSADRFQTRNQFYGGQLGLRGQYFLGNLFLGASVKVGLGENHETMQISGFSSLFQPGAPTTSVNVGQFAGPSNIGRFNRDEFVVVPEVEVKVGYNVTQRVGLFVGYNLLYMSNVVRANHQVDLLVDDRTNPVNGMFTTLTQTTAFPRPLFSRTDFWAQGINLGLEFRF
jgi:hypothetical protein